jgi:hypothetical protein
LQHLLPISDYNVLLRSQKCLFLSYYRCHPSLLSELFLVEIREIDLVIHVDGLIDSQQHHPLAVQHLLGLATRLAYVDEMLSYI